MSDDDAQRALRESEERYRAFVANSSEAIWRFELDEPCPLDLPIDEQIEHWYRHGFLAECNDVMARMYGFASSEEIVGARLGDMLVRDDPNNIAYLRAFAESGYRLIGAESHEIDRDGQEKYFVNNLIAVIENGRLIRAWGTQRDVTEQHLLVDRLERANRMKDEFLAMLSHELRTPITSTLGWATMLQTGALPPEMFPTAIDSIAQSTRLQARLIDDLLDISRIVAGKMHLTLRPIAVLDPLGAAIEIIRPAAEAKHIDLQIELAARDARVRGDGERLQQVFWNVLSNAVKFTPRLGTVHVALTGESDAVRVVVRDSGEGIDADLLPYVFERFRQGDSGATRRFGGLGLGLAIARNLVELHGGMITATSEGKDRGAQLTIVLPTTVAESDEPRSAPAPAPLDGFALLVVEDDNATRTMLDVALRQYGAEVVAVANAADAVEALSARAFDVVIVDIGLPEEDGITLLRRVRASGNAIPAIAVTAYAGDAEKARALEAGYESFLAKPVDPQSLCVATAALGRR